MVPLLPLQGVTAEGLAHLLGIDPASSRKIVSAVHRGKWNAPVPGLRRGAREVAATRCHLPTLELRQLQRSVADPFVKIVVGLPDGHVVETVRIPLERAGRFSVCVSSQVGCALACAFCATGRLGLSRNLETWEIVEQVRMVRSTLVPGARVHGVVFQGMGEPLANVDRVVEAVRVMCDPSALAIDARAITVCTAGLPAGIDRIARDVPKVRLAVSIGSARAEVRRRIMPIDATHPLDKVMRAVENHARATGLSPMFAVTPLAGVNDTEDDARALAELGRDFAARTGKRPRISVVPYNSIAEGGGDPFARGDVDRFASLLVERGIKPHVRYSGGADIAAACGQLAGR